LPLKALFVGVCPDVDVLSKGLSGSAGFSPSEFWMNTYSNVKKPTNTVENSNNAIIRLPIICYSNKMDIAFSIPLLTGQAALGVVNVQSS
jgi:hypothetical protein